MKHRQKRPSTPIRENQEVAAIDLGSNSFHLVVVRQVMDEIVVIDRVRDQVQLAAGLKPDGRLDRPARKRALASLARFAERITGIEDHRVRTVGTNTLRAARGADDFLAEAERVLGRRIDVISGEEEARLIYRGVSRALATTDQERLIIDIGGGSTELIVGKGTEPVMGRSLQMGCVTFSERFFPDREMNEELYLVAKKKALEHLESAAPLLDRTWAHAVGSSGTIRTVARILRRTGWSDRGITKDGMRRLEAALLAGEDVADLELPGLRRSRASVFTGGFAILSAIMERARIEELSYSPDGLREGVLFELLGALHFDDGTDPAIRRLQQRYLVDRDQSVRVRNDANALLSQVDKPWDLTDSDARLRLDRACDLHELGLAVAWKRHQDHGAYIIRNSELPGLGAEDKEVVARIVECQRRELRPADFAGLPSSIALKTLRLSIILRLSVLVNRRRMDHVSTPMILRVDNNILHVHLPKQWLKKHPLSSNDLEGEGHLVRKVMAMRFHAE